MGRCAASLVTVFIALTISIGSAVSASSTTQSAESGPRRVLVLHSYGQDFSPWNAITGGFRQQLIMQSPHAIELHEVSLPTDRFEQARDQRPFLDYLRALFNGRDLDLLVAMGAPAARFLQRTRPGLFPSVPLLITGADERTFNDTPLGPNDTAVAVGFDQAIRLDRIMVVLG